MAFTPPQDDWAQANSPGGPPPRFLPAPAPGTGPDGAWGPQPPFVTAPVSEPSTAVVPAAHSRGDGSHGVLSIIAALAMMAGLVVAVAPLGNWFKLSFGALGGAVTGYGQDRPNDATEKMIDSQDLVGGSESDAVSGSDESYDWILEPVPDGMPVTGLGLLLAATGLVMLSRSRDGSLDPAKRRAVMLRLSGGLAVGSAAGIAWIAMSWHRYEQEFQKQFAEVGDDPLAAMFLGAVNIERGYGLIVAGLALAAIGLLGGAAFLLVVSGNDRLPISITIGDRSPGPPPAPGFAPGGHDATIPTPMAPASTFSSWDAPRPATTTPPEPSEPSEPATDSPRDSWNDYPL